MNRDDYVEKLKARAAQAEVKAEYDRQLEAINARRDEARYQMKLLQNASADAWKDVLHGADEASKRLQEAVSAARSRFGKD